MKGGFESDLIYFSPTSRLLYQLLIYPIVSVGFLGNLGVLIRLFLIPGKTCLKPFYRASLMSLALSDLLLLGTTGSNLLAVLSSRTILWSLEEWACTVLPFLQTVAVLVASLILAGVAIDRFSAFKRKISISRGPGWIPTVSYVLLVWSVAAGASYPILDLYKPQSLHIINNSTIYRGILCVNDREKAKTAYIGIFVVIFLPLTIAFLAVHVLLALSINQRKAPGESSRSEINLSRENSTASTDLDRPKPGIPKIRVPLPAHVQRKQRTVRVILLLILVFVVCRLPQWTFLLFKTLVVVQGWVWWHLQVVLSTLSLFNAAIHPFLYAFLNEALSIVDWVRLICSRNRKSIDIESTESRVKERSSSGEVKIPRGPYSP
ncbi:QRFP-like peptide receptor [Diachasma alloeum]|uniref:QRFP-like peptide receptor n=1 Tax=Diachasma alloeum TaxID=454923 RepID=UPI0007382014|nr:QRFP-like peptide receptor [Diachasma alloeum]XP_015114977.1 QRFP-like peptide receptor [Diachasma alloeum]XP_015114978.1 QRFP-like peptide receptor [Diachasma alloeum]